MAEYTIQSTSPALYLDKGGKAITGFTVYFLLTDFDELHNVNVPTLAEKDVKPAVELILAQRKALAKLGQSK
jgi:hypothetical protein